MAQLNVSKLFHETALDLYVAKTSESTLRCSCSNINEKLSANEC
jgi:hypothetical protein